MSPVILQHPVISKKIWVIIQFHKRKTITIIINLLGKIFWIFLMERNVGNAEILILCVIAHKSDAYTL